ncbi:sigma-54-dependent Fis family transcriptional regulator [Bacillus sp. S/N-304-OC-R1]|uniref:sigma-54 interaction domain-containing protein n=1 Tax=Bacillus sp. S/N-304-OC-R1 TaxID=2758034 RepID=UPI0021AEE56C|nr:sigma 54-interacting transcriptional regulator [Bacillus sp. S/N-304-OC-R1]
METADLKQLSDFDNVLVVDKTGKTIFYDLADLHILKKLGEKPEEFLGKNITSFYKNLTEENSTLMRAIKTGEALINVEQQMISKTGSSYVSKSSTYPIKQGDEIVGAIEFSKHYFTKENIQFLDEYAGHKMYRKNNTIYTIDDIVTVNPQMMAVKEKIKKVARTDSTVLIYGHTGTGKEVVAQSIHNLSDRFGKPFISFNCGAIPASLLESTLFGTTKGSFTGAEDMPGLFEQAEGGTLFLDEINSLDINLQVKLLKAIEEKTIRRIGGKKNIQLDIRVLSATNEDPDLLVEEKRLRQDLFFRLGVVQINLPKLSVRPDDIEVLLKYYINFYNNIMNIYVEGMTEEALQCFKRYSWPGNIRELKNAVENAFNQVNTSEITIDDIPDRIRNFSGKANVIEKVPKVQSLRDAVEDYEKSIIMNEWIQTNGKIAETARRLGLSKQSLKYKLEKYNIK